MTEQEKIQSIIKKIQDENSSEVLRREQIEQLIDDELQGFKLDNQEEWRIHYVKERIKRGALSALKDKEKFKSAHIELSTKWLNYYISWRIPFSIFFYFLFIVEYIGHPSNYFIIFLVFFAIEFIYAFLMIGLSKRRLWAWRLNNVILLIESLVFFIWGILNWFYFKKRKKLFS